MKLYTLGIPFMKMNRDILLLRSRSAMLEILRLSGSAFTLEALKNGTPYSHRVQREALAELSQRGLVTLNAKGIPTVNATPPHQKADVPTHLPWSTLSFAELKVSIALYAEARHQRAPYFSWEGRHDELGKVARLNRKATGMALARLADKGILKATALRDKGSRWTRGTLVQLLDIHSGASLNDLARFYHNRMDRLDVLTRYRLALAPQFDFVQGFTAESGMMLSCPFCLNRKRTFRVTATDTADQWRCFACGKSGDSTRLCALRSFQIWKAREFNLTELAAYLGADSNRDVLMEGITNACVG